MQELIARRTVRWSDTSTYVVQREHGGNVFIFLNERVANASAEDVYALLNDCGGVSIWETSRAP